MRTMRRSMKTLFRNKTKYFLCLIMSIFFTVFLIVINSIIHLNNEKIIEAYETIPVSAFIDSKNSLRDKIIPYEGIKSLEKSEFVKEYHYYSKLSCNPSYNESISSNLLFYTNILDERLFREHTLELVMFSGYDRNAFSMDENLCIVSENDMQENNLNGREEIKLYSPIKGNYITATICGYYKTTDKILSFDTHIIFSNMYTYINNYKGFLTDFENDIKPSIIELMEVRYDLKNLARLDEFKMLVDTSIFTESRPGDVGYYMSNLKLHIDDEKLTQVTSSLKRLNNRFRTSIPIVLLMIAFISFGMSYYITSSNLSNIALLRVLGVSKSSVTVEIIIENTLIGLLGIAAGVFICIGLLGNFGLDLYAVRDKIGIDLSIYFASFTIGGVISSIIITHINTIKILTKRD